MSVGGGECVVKLNLMLRCCCVGWHVAGQDFLLDYSVFLSVSQRQDSLYVQEEFASVESLLS